MTINKRILLVEDERLILDTLTDLLQPSGYIIKSAPEGNKALEVLRRYRPHLIISDVMMPGMDGFKLLQELKSNKEWNDIPVILLTAKKEIEDRINGLQTGADAYISKPFNFHELRLIVHNLLVLKENIVKGSFSRQQEIEEVDDEAFFAKEVNAFLNSHFSEQNLSLTVLSDHFKMSCSGLKKKLKRSLSKTFHELISEFRLHKAKSYLASQKFNVSEVARMTGFKSTAHFSDSFKKQFGFPPSDILK